MLTDAASIVLALVAMRLSPRPAAGIFTYGPAAHRDPLRAAPTG